MDLGSWLVAEHDDAQHRLSTQILEVVPAERRRERLPGANSVDWTVFHVARHAGLALRVLGHDPAMSDALLDGVPAEVAAPSAGLQETQQPLLDAIDTPQLEAYALSVFDEVRAFLGHQDAASIDVLPDVAAALRRAGLDEQEFDWVYRQWSTPHVLYRWTLGGHITHHIGELTGVRNQMGLSPFRS
jgi:hypothetical protein